MIQPNLLIPHIEPRRSGPWASDTAGHPASASDIYQDEITLAK